MTNENEVKSKKNTPEWLQVIIGGLFLLIVIIVIIAIVGGGEKKPEVPQVLFSQQIITESSVREAIKDLTGLSVGLKGNITKIEVNDYAPTLEILDDKIVNIYYKPTALWDERASMTTAVHTAIKTMETLFKNPKVAEVVMWQQGEFTDQYGETKTRTAIRILMNKETANKIVDWKVIDDRAWLDYNTFFDLAELQYIHPAIKKAL